MRTSEYLKNAVFAALTLIVAGFAAGVGCSMDNPAKLGGTFSIKIEDDVNAPKYFSLAQDLGLGVHGYGSHLFTAGPTTSGDFDCFHVNITGPGIISNHEIGPECTILDNLHGRGQGIVSRKPVRRGEYIDLDLLPGPGRRIDAYGVYPPEEECGGANNIAVDQKGYYMGGVDVDIRPNLQVTIPVTFQLDQPPSVACKNDLGLRLGSTNSPHIGYYNVFISGTSPWPAPSPTPTPSPAITFSGADYAAVQYPDSQGGDVSTNFFFLNSTSYPGVTEVMISFNVTNLTLSDFSRFEANILATAGTATSGCNTQTFTGFIPSGFVQVWNSSIGQWENIQSGTITSPYIQFFSQSFQNPDAYPQVYGGQKWIWIRTYVVQTSTGCRILKLDFASLRLLRN